MREITEKDFVKALNAIAETEAGQVVLFGLKDSCGWDKTYIASDNPTVSHYYAVKRGVYGGLRDRIKPELLKKIEFDYKRKVEKKDDGSSRRIASNGPASSAASTPSKRSGK